MKLMKEKRKQISTNKKRILQAVFASTIFFVLMKKLYLMLALLLMEKKDYHFMFVHVKCLKSFQMRIIVFLAIK